MPPSPRVGVIRYDAWFLTLKPKDFPHCFRNWRKVMSTRFCCTMRISPDGSNAGVGSLADRASPTYRFFPGWTMIGIAGAAQFMSGPGQSYSVAAFKEPCTTSTLSPASSAGSLTFWSVSAP